MDHSQETDADRTHDRYPGLGAFTEYQSHIFYGRETEKTELLNLILGEKIVVVFAQSGTGKSSLLNAGIIPKLRSGEHLPICITFKDWDKTDESPKDLFTQILSSYFHPENIPYTEKKEDLRLWEYIKACDFDATPVLVFDQFEEFFNFPKGKRDIFIMELAEVLHSNLPNFIIDRMVAADESTAPWYRQPVIKVVFSIRADRLFEMDEMGKTMPHIHRHRYELKSLTSGGARDCIICPAESKGWHFATKRYTFAPSAIDTILGLFEGRKEVESSQLQIICEQIEKMVRALQKTAPIESMITVDANFFDGENGLKKIIDSYYVSRLSLVPDEDRLCVQLLLENELLKDDRRVILSESLVLNRINNKPALLRRLLDLRLLREDYYKSEKVLEISHDTLINSIVNARRERTAVEREERQARETKANSLSLAKIYLREHYPNSMEAKDNDGAYQALESALKIYTSFPGQEVNQVRTMIRKGKFFARIGKSNDAKTSLLAALDLAQKIGNTYWEGVVYETLGILTDDPEMLTTASMGFFETALKLFRESNDHYELARLSENIGVLYEAEYERQSQDMDCLEKSLRHYTNACENYGLAEDLPGKMRSGKSADRVKRILRPFGYLVNLFTGEPIVLQGLSPFTIGRSTDTNKNHVSIDNMVVSRRHIQIHPNLLIEDLNSLNGTSINSIPLMYGTPGMLRDHDIIVLSNSFPLQFSKDKPQAEIPAQSVWGLLIDAGKKTFSFLTDHYYTIAIREGKTEPYQLELKNGKQKDQVLELMITEDTPRIRFSGIDRSDPGKADGQGNRWCLSALLKNLDPVEKGYSQYYILPDIEDHMSLLSGSLQFTHFKESIENYGPGFQIVLRNQISYDH